MKRFLILLFCLLLSATAFCQINYIGNYVDEQWLKKEFGESYTITAGDFNRDSGYLINGKVVIGSMEIETSRNGRCDMITIESKYSDVKRIKEDADRFFSYNYCTNVKKSVHDGISTDHTYELTYEGSRLIGSRYISLYAKAMGSYNGYGTFFPSFYRKTIVASGL